MTTDKVKNLDKVILPKDGPTGGAVSQDVLDAIKERQEAILQTLHTSVRSSSSPSGSAGTAGGSVTTQEASSTNLNEDNGVSNCGPASLTNALKDFGIEKVDPESADGEIAETRSEMGASSDESEFTDTSQIAKGARANGLVANEYKGGATTDDIDKELSNNKEAIVNVNSVAGGWGNAEAHFVTVVGKDSEGNYLVKDPKSEQVLTIPKEQMAAAMNDREGYMVAVGRKDGKAPNTGVDQATA
jgi:predicted double-glycine peptidase